MKAILQRVISASVTVDKQVVSSIGKGILVLAAVAPGDTEKEVDALAAKVIKMKLWDDEETGGRWKHNVQDISGDVLCVSQFTLLANTKKGSKPDFHGAMGGEHAKELYQRFVSKVGEGYNPEKVKDGVFQAMMEVALINDGPVTFEMSVEPKPVGPKKSVEPKKSAEPKKP
ncbi:D-tyrosyl-tRNA(Tyr) deacylase [Pseudogymnoascus sp. 05NY08]|nr:D-tyrosyl-tRNA(Tyr) deacylase [Pseudogymnoascus sp. 05NY08]